MPINTQKPTSMLLLLLFYLSGMLPILIAIILIPFVPPLLASAVLLASIFVNFILWGVYIPKITKQPQGGE